ncbi:MAG: sterol desaturase family protein [Myxococcota bacterium]
MSGLELLRQWYAEPLFIDMVVITSFLSMGAFLVFALPLTLLAWWEPRWIRPYRIQERRPAGWPMMKAALKVFVLNNLLLFGLSVLLWPVFRLSSLHNGVEPTPLLMMGQIFCFVLLEDYLFYFFHRALHRDVFYRMIHGMHHRFRTPWALAAHYMHPLEFLVSSGLVLVGPLILGAHVWTLWVWVVIRQAISADGHSGYDLPFNPLRLLLVYRGPRLHDLHHARVEGNYGLMYILDRAFSSETGVKEERRVPRLQKYFGNRLSWTGWHRSSARTRRNNMGDATNMGDAGAYD